MLISQASRIELRWLDLSDAAFIVDLVNQPGWLRFIGDRGVHTLEDAAVFLQDGPFAMYQNFGFGHYMVQRREDNERLGLCGLIKRANLPDVDLGFAISAPFQGLGYANEAADAVIRYARETLELARLLAITNPDNEISGKLLTKLGFHEDGTVQMLPESIPLKRFMRTL